MGILGGGGGSKWAKKTYKLQKKQAKEREKGLKKSRAVIDKRFDEFDSGYFKELRNTARDFYRPQFDDQYDNARKSLRFGLARSGNSLSSTGADSLGDLARDRSLGLSRVADLSKEAVTQQRGLLEDQRATMYQQAAASHDPKAAAKSSVGRSEYLSRPPEFSSIGDLFANVLGQAATYEKAERYGDRQGWGAFGGMRTVRDAQGNSHQVRYGTS